MPVSIWDFVKDQVNNKGALDRIYHSARFHPLRSAINSKGSFGSKLLGGVGVAGRTACNLIPIPIFGSLLAQAQAAIEKRIRSYCHNKHTDPADKVKFSLKEISVENLDSYRFKVDHSVKEVEEELKVFNADAAHAADHGKKCVPELAIALKIAQAERRLEKFENEVNGLIIILQASKAWADAARRSVTDAKTQVSAKFSASHQIEVDLLKSAGAVKANQDSATATIKSWHAHCTSSIFSTDYCTQRANTVGGSWNAMIASAAEVVRTLQEPFSVESFIALDRTSFESSDRLENY